MCAARRVNNRLRNKSNKKIEGSRRDVLSRSEYAEIERNSDDLENKNKKKRKKNKKKFEILRDTLYNNNAATTFSQNMEQK